MLRAANESLLAGLAAKKLSGAKEALDTAADPDSDALWHYESGLLSSQEGNYAAAIYDATYAETMQGITTNGAVNETAAVQGLSSGGRSSLWGRIYYAHGLYLAAEDNESGMSQDDAYRILAYSLELDKATAEMQAALAPSANQTMAPAPGGHPETPCQPLLPDSSLILLATGAAAGLIAAAAIWQLLAGQRKDKKASGRKGKRT